jgi:hypothetical protein
VASFEESCSSKRLVFARKRRSRRSRGHVYAASEHSHWLTAALVSLGSGLGSLKNDISYL